MGHECSEERSKESKSSVALGLHVEQVSGDRVQEVDMLR